jgi:hypothetical protein
VRQVGNAWNPILMWAPQVHAWMKRNNPNDDTAKLIQAIYA